MFCVDLDESPCHHVFQKQITDLSLVHKRNPVLNVEALMKRKYSKGVHGYMIQFFENLRHFNIVLKIVSHYLMVVSRIYQRVHMNPTI